MSGAEQGDLFGSAAAARPDLPPGFIYREDFITAEEEAGLLAHIARLPLSESRYHQWTAKRRTVSYGGSYDFSHQSMGPADPVPEFLHALRARLAAWAGVAPEQFSYGLVTEYRPGTQLGWHRDVPDFELVAGVSLQGVARMRFRPYPPASEVARATCHIDLAPRSAYLIRDAARWEWQHAVSPTKMLRYSITLRTARDRRGRAGAGASRLR